MHRVGKLLWIIFVVWIVFFIILNEKWINNKIEKKSDLFNDYENEAIIDNSNENALMFDSGDENNDKLDQDVDNTKIEQSSYKKWNKKTTSSNASISEMLSSYANDNNSTEKLKDEDSQMVWDFTGSKLYQWNVSNLEIKKTIKFVNKSQQVEQSVWEKENELINQNTDERYNLNSEEEEYEVDFIAENTNTLSINIYNNEWLLPLSLKESKKISRSKNEKTNLDDSNFGLDNDLKIYKWNFDGFNLKHSKSNAKQFEMAQDNTWIEIWLSEDVLGNLLAKEDIDIKTLESENDEFLQRVFQDTRDPDVLNTILKTYISEYQFSKAKKYIENLPEMYREQIEPWLNLMISFNSFSLSSKTIKDQLTSLVKWYSDLWKISQEDASWYQWVILLMHKEYDKFFELAWSFSLDDHKKLASKLQWYQEQIKNQKWMPEYYFDTLVSLELFNNGFFQPAKVIALTSLQKNSNYILPYQVLAYANFLTNSWDTSTEYLKKLIELDPNNAEKYRFLMWVAYYRNEKYEQSVVMLSLIRDSKLHLDAQRYLINDYLQLKQNNKLISIWNKLLWSENLVDSDFYTYFYEAFYHPYSLWENFDIYEYDTQLADKMLQVCAMRLADTQRAVCTYGKIWKDIAMWNFDNLERSLLSLAENYPQWYLYQALWEYYVKQWDLDKAKVYLLKAIQLTQKSSERSQIKKLLQATM